MVPPAGGFRTSLRSRGGPHGRLCGSRADAGRLRQRPLDLGKAAVEASAGIFGSTGRIRAVRRRAPGTSGQPGEPRADPARWGREGGWNARYRGGIGRPRALVVESRADLFDSTAERSTTFWRTVTTSRARPGRSRRSATPAVAHPRRRRGRDDDRAAGHRRRSRFYRIAWRDHNATASVIVEGFAGKFRSPSARPGAAPGIRLRSALAERRTPRRGSLYSRRRRPFGEHETRERGVWLRRITAVLVALAGLSPSSSCCSAAPASANQDPLVGQDDEEVATPSPGRSTSRTSRFGTTITECPQAGSIDEQPKPLDRRDKDEAEKKSSGGNDRPAQPGLLLPAAGRDDDRPEPERMRATSSPVRTTTGSAGARRASTRRPTTASTGTTASRRSRRCRAATTSTAAAIRSRCSTAPASSTTRRSTSTAPTTRAACG